MVRLLLHDGLCGVGLGLILVENAQATLQTNDVTRDIKWDRLTAVFYEQNWAFINEVNEARPNGDVSILGRFLSLSSINYRVP